MSDVPTMSPDELLVLLDHDLAPENDHLTRKIGGNPYALLREARGIIRLLLTEDEVQSAGYVRRIQELRAEAEALRAVRDAALGLYRDNEDSLGLNFNDEMGDWQCSYCDSSSNFGEPPTAVRHSADCSVLTFREAIARIAALEPQ